MKRSKEMKTVNVAQAMYEIEAVGTRAYYNREQVEDIVYDENTDMYIIYTVKQGEYEVGHNTKIKIV